MNTIILFLLTLLTAATIGVLFWVIKEALELRDQLVKLAVIVCHLDEQKQ